MAIANVTLNNTFDEWRTTTNQLINFVNEIDSQQLINVASNTAVLSVSPSKVSRNQTLYITLNSSSDVLDNSVLNVATANIVNAIFGALTNTNSRLVLVSDNANTINAIANAAIIQANTARTQANTARDHANAAFLAANTGLGLGAAFLQANTARDHANAAFLSSNSVSAIADAGLAQANTARVHANNSFEKANAAYDLASTVSGNTVPIIEANRAGFLQANLAYEQANTARVHANVGFSQANTARDHANAAFLAANNAVTDYSPAFIQANTARVHANAAFLQANTSKDHANSAFSRANVGFSNTAGSSFVGNMQIPTGNLSIGEGDTQGIRLHVNSWIGVANVLPQVEIMGGSQFIQFNSNTSFGAWNDLMIDRDISIIYSRGSSDDGANLVIGPWTDSSFGYKQDGAGRHGFNTSNPRQVLDANGSANISGSLLVWNNRSDAPMNVVATVTSAFTKANTIGTLGTQSSSSVSITGGSITGITDLALADGGTNASLTASAGAIAYSSASALALSSVGSSGQVLISGGTEAPVWSAQTSLSVGTATTFTSTTSNSQFNSIGVGTAASTTAGEIRATNEVTAYYSSDIELKTNITPIENALDKIRQISGVMFDWKDEEIERRGGEDGYFVRKHDTGVIAQEVEAVLPEVVATREDGYKAVKYEKLAGLIIQAINELANEVDKLKSK